MQACWRRTSPKILVHESGRAVGNIFLPGACCSCLPHRRPSLQLRYWVANFIKSTSRSYVNGGRGRCWLIAIVPIARGDLCKHIWAALLAIQESYAEQLRQLGPAPEWISIDFSDEDYWDDEFDEDNDEEFDESADDDESGDIRCQELQRKIKRLNAVRSVTSTVPVGDARRPPLRKEKPPDQTPEWQKTIRQMALGAHRDYRQTKVDTFPIEPFYILELEDCQYSKTPVLSLAYRQPTAGGKLGKIKKLPLTPGDIARIPDQTDRDICMLLLGAGAQYDRYGYQYGSDAGQSRWQLSPPLQEKLLPLLPTNERFLLREKRDSKMSPLRLDGGDPWEFVLTIERDGMGNSHELRGQLRRGREHRAIESDECYIQGSPGLFISNDLVSRFETHNCFTWIETFRTQKSLRFNRDELPKLLEELSRLQAFPPIEWPSDWKVTEVDGLPPLPELALQVDDSRNAGVLCYAQGKLKFRYGEVTTDILQPGRVIVDVKEARLIRRNIAAEQRHLNRLRELGVRENYYGDGFEILPKKLPKLIGTLVAENWTVLGNRKLYRQPGLFKINVSSGIDWFEVEGQVDFDGQTAKLPELLAALRGGEQFVKLGDGSFGMLPEDWLRKHRGWLEMGQAQQGHVRFSKTQIGLIDALLAEMPEATFDRNLAEARKKLAAFAGVKAHQEPRGFHGTLRSYQREGLGWLRFLEDFEWGGCLADDMGLGKTVQLLALLADRRRQAKHGPSLVVAPKSVVFNWARETQRFAPRLRVLDYTGLDRKQQREALSEYDLVLTTYGTLRRDIKYLREQSFNYVVLDEAQAIKNPESQSAKATRLLQARRRLALTGTPVENRTSDIWSIFEFLNPGMLGTVKIFKNIAGNGEEHRENLPLLQRMLRPFILRRTKDQVAPELPRRSEQTLDCVLSSKQAAYYKELRDHYRASLLTRVDDIGLARSKMHVLEALLRLRQAACHPGLIDESKTEAESAKLETLLAMVTELIGEGHKALIFSQFTKMLALVRTALDRQGMTYEYLDGKTRRRHERIDHFQNDASCQLFLISLKAGGTGLNLTAADYVFILDPWWNPAVEAQAIDRTHRIGQKKRVIAYRLIARDTVEEKILTLQQTKKELAEALITEKNSLIRNLTREDLALLLS